jgi:hypothetical protein
MDSTITIRNIPGFRYTTRYPTEHGSHGRNARYRIGILILINCVLATEKDLPNRFRRSCIVLAWAVRSEIGIPRTCPNLRGKGGSRPFWDKYIWYNIWTCALKFCLMRRVFDYLRLFSIFLIPIFSEIIEIISTRCAAWRMLWFIGLYRITKTHELPHFLWYHC